MRSPSPAARTRFSLKASHHRFTLKISHRRSEEGDETITREAERDRYIAPPKRRR